MAKLIVILGFLLSFAAGMVIGTRTHGLLDRSDATTTKPPTTAPSDRRTRGGWLSQELGLSAEQRAQLDKIWSATASRAGSDHEDRRREYRRERDTAIADLVPTARLGEYDQIINTYQDRVAALEAETREAYQQAVEQTRQILTPEQRTRYEDILKKHKWGPYSSRDRHSSSRRSESGPTTTTSQDSLKGATQ
jgi:Spy/CpxP family protein refolding chaperone